MDAHKYILQKYKGMNTRHRCPGCNDREKTFSLYIDTVTGDALAPTVGRCNRFVKCGYHYPPKQYFADKGIPIDKAPCQPMPRHKPAPPKAASLIPAGVFKGSLQSYEVNNFVTFLIGLFGHNVTKELIEKYYIGTSKHWHGATAFWQIDTHGQIKAGKIMLYSPVTGKRVKEPYNHVTWVHSAMKLADFNLKQCLFGEHLLKDTAKPVAIVESEKTAIIASVYLPQFIWVAVGSLNNLNAEKCQPLAGRTVILYPDLNGFALWCEKAKELSHVARFAVSDLLERKATQNAKEKNIDGAELKKQGYDIADFLIHGNSVVMPAAAYPPGDCGAALETFEKWLQGTPAGGVFDYEAKKYLVVKNYKTVTPTL